MQMAISFRSSGKEFPEGKAVRDLFTGMNNLIFRHNNWTALQRKGALLSSQDLCWACL
jgi:hypothetical protein